MRTHSRRYRGWTLIQVAAAMAIAAILVLAAIPAYQMSRIKAYVSEARIVSREWSVASSAYFAQDRSWQGATDQSVGWTSPNSRVWNYGPHMYGPQGYEAEAWFIANLRSRGQSCDGGDPGDGGLIPFFPGTGQAAAGIIADPSEDPGEGNACDPDYMLIMDAVTRTMRECGALLNKPCGDRGRIAMGGSGSGDGPPSAPQNLRVLAEYNSAISIAWDPVSNVDIYTVQWRPTGYPDWDWAQDDSGGTSYIITWLPQESVYEIRVVARNAHGEAASSPVTATNVARPPRPPGFLVVSSFPTNLRGSPPVADAELAWYDYAEGEDGYRTEIRPHGSTSWTVSQNLSPNSIFGPASPIPEGTPYEARAVVYNAYGSSPSRTAYLFFDRFTQTRPWFSGGGFARTTLEGGYAIMATYAGNEARQSALPGPPLVRGKASVRITLRVTGSSPSLTRAWLSVRGAGVVGSSHRRHPPLHAGRRGDMQRGASGRGLPGVHGPGLLQVRAAGGYPRSRAKRIVPSHDFLRRRQPGLLRGVCERCAQGQPHILLPDLARRPHLHRLPEDSEQHGVQRRGRAFLEPDLPVPAVHGQPGVRSVTPAASRPGARTGARRGEGTTSAPFPHGHSGSDFPDCVESPGDCPGMGGRLHAWHS